MPAATKKPQKRVLGDSTKAHANAKATLPSPSAAKRRKIETGSSPSKRLKVSQNGVKTGSSQPKSQFEEEVLEKLTQDITGLKQNNSERDQQWDRPGLDDFDEEKDSLCFQQIDAEEGTLHGGKTTIKLFGVTEVDNTPSEVVILPNIPGARLDTLYFSMSLTSSTISMLQLQSHLRRRIPRVSRHISRLNWHYINRQSTRSKW